MLTAIVITFGVVSFLLALAFRSWRLTADDEVEDDRKSPRRRAAGTDGGAPVNAPVSLPVLLPLLGAAVDRVAAHAPSASSASPRQRRRSSPRCW